MSKQCSKPYEIGGSKYSFDIVDGKIAGIQKADSSGSFASLENTYLNPKLSNFGDIAATDEALEAYNIAKHGPNIDAYEDTAPQLTSAELQSYFNKQDKKSSNQSFISNDTDKPPSLAFAAPNSGAYDAYQGSKGKKHGSDIFAYPLDIDPQQDHLKICKYNYTRREINKSNNPNIGGLNAGEFNKSKIGSSVKGMTFKGSVILPMPKVEDVNGVDYGENKLGISGLIAMGIINAGANIVGTRQASEVEKKRIQGLNKALKDAQGGLGETLESGGEAATASGAAMLANMAGANLDTNTILARSGAGVLNPSAEMLFQGPVIRDFSFNFLMIARGQKEGEEIRRIIRWFKTGAAPKYQDRVIIKNPDIFKLEYRNGDGVLKTTNRFLDAMALQTISVDYAPNGYWSAYRDSQPVAIRLGLNFTELRPVYEAEQEMTPPDSVGF